MFIRELTSRDSWKLYFESEYLLKPPPKEYGARILDSADYMIASTTTFADSVTEKLLNNAADNNNSGHGIYLATGALWGALDIQKMSDAGKLSSLQVRFFQTKMAFFYTKLNYK